MVARVPATCKGAGIGIAQFVHSKAPGRASPPRQEAAFRDGGREATMDLLKRIAGEGPSVDEVREALRAVVDPELGVNIVDLGLVYGVDIAEGKVRIRLTLTAPACPMGEMIVAEVRREVQLTVAGVKEVAVDLVWDPPWAPTMMSEEARLTLGM